jgi:hypothetical protein
MNVTKKEMLIIGIKEIAQNHECKPLVENWEEDMSVSILGGNNVPTIADVQMLANDLGIDEQYIYTNIFGVDLDIPYDWYEEEGDKPYVPQCDFWRRK